MNQNHTTYMYTGPDLLGESLPPCEACVEDDSKKPFVGIDHGERAIVQLAGCGVAALGCTSGPNVAEPGMYGWSASYGDVLKLRLAFDKIAGGRSPDQVLASEI